MAKRVEKKTLEETFTAKRKWGYEKWIENLDEYCGKSLFLDKGKKCSMHFHMNKLETMYLISGHIQIRFRDPLNAEDYIIELLQGDSVRIPRGQQHQIIAVEDSHLIEFSTKHQETDSYRVELGSI